VNEVNLNNVKREAGRNLMKKEREYLKNKINELESNSKIRISKNCIGAKLNLC
jgi:hypothetical protein